ncbi:MAG: GNAT family N-acetyltransferase [Crocinitomicaceae bacterium]|nr:GNAT family N-acetyltransferase [Crocinitomicaceae bacterium]
MMQPTFREINHDQEGDIQTISVLANSILHEFYGPQMPEHHINYYLDTYQSKKAIQEQLQNSWKYFLIELNGVAIGYMSVKIENDKMVLSKLYVLANQRNTGAGKAAMGIINELVEKNNIKTLELFVNQLNDRAIGFYKKHGFKVTDEVTNTYGSGHTENDYLMIKTLA